MGGPVIMPKASPFREGESAAPVPQSDPKSIPDMANMLWCLCTTKVADHLFCKYCGVKSFYKPASHPNSVSINYHSIIKPPKIKEILFFDGKNWDQAIKNLKS